MKSVWYWRIPLTILLWGGIFYSCQAQSRTCIRGTIATLVVITSTYSSITSSTASAGGNAAFGTNITVRGTCYGLTSGITKDSSHTTDGAGLGSFISSLTGLTPNALYHYKAYATNDLGTSYGGDSTFMTSPPLDVTPPSEPTTLALIGSITTMDLTWIDPTASDLAKIYVYRGLSTNPTTLLDSVDSGVQVYTDVTPSEGNIYFYRLRARDGVYNISGYSSNVSDTCNVTIPTITIAGNVGKITVTNTQPGAGDSLRIYRGVSTNPTTWVYSMAFNTSHIDTPLTQGTIYFYRAKALISGILSDYSLNVNDTCNIDITPPSAPTDLVATGNTTNIGLTWTDPTAPDLAKIYIYKALTTNPTVLFDSVNAGAQTYTDAAVTNGSIYFYRLKARDNVYNTSGYSSNANDTCNIIPDVTPPSAPTSLAAVGSIGSLSLTWTDPTAIDLSKIYIYRALTTDPTVLIDSVDPGVETYTDNAVTEGLIYFYRLKARDNVYNISGYSDNANDTCNITPPAYVNYYVDRDAGGTGSGLSWTNASKTIVDLPWSSINGGDTVYVSGGSDSTVYLQPNSAAKNYITSKTATGSPIVITKGWESGHNGDVYFAQSAAKGFSFYVLDCNNIKLVNLKFNVELVGDAGGNALQIFNSSNIIVDSCTIVSDGSGNGIGFGAFDGGVMDSLTVNNCTITILANNYTQDNQDNIHGGWGDGGHTFTNNKLYNYGYNTSPHNDLIQIGNGGSVSNLQTTIANNFFYYKPQSPATGAGNVYISGSWGDRYLIYNNIFICGATPTFTGVWFYRHLASSHLSMRILNNTFVSNQASATPITNFDAVTATNCGADTLIIKNNIIVQDSGALQYMKFTNLADSIAYKDIDYNHYYSTGGNSAYWVDYTSHGIAWSAWKALGYDAHSDTGKVNFINNIGATTRSYEAINILNIGTDLSSLIPASDIFGTSRPQMDVWDMGAIENIQDAIKPSKPTSLVAQGGYSNTQVPITWTASSDSDVVKTYIYEGSTNDTTALSLIDSVGIGINSYTRTGRTASTTYWYATLTRDFSFNYSYFSNTDSATTTVDPFSALITDGNTVGWYSMFDLTKNANNKVTSWTDTSGSGHHLLQADTSKSPTWSADGVSSDAVNDVMQASFTLAQPVTVYIIFRANTWTNNKKIFDAYTDSKMMFYMYSTATLRIYSTTALSISTTISTGTFYLVTAVFDSAASAGSINAGAPVTGNAGRGTPAGFTLFNEGSGSYFSAATVKEIIIRKVNETSGNRTIIRNYLNAKYSVY